MTGHLLSLAMLSPIVSGIGPIRAQLTYDAPLAGVARVRHLFELTPGREVHHGREPERGKAIIDGQHPLVSFLRLVSDRERFSTGSEKKSVPGTPRA